VQLKRACETIPAESQRHLTISIDIRSQSQNVSFDRFARVGQFGYEALRSTISRE